MNHIVQGRALGPLRRIVLGAGLAAALAGCGVDGEPIQPSMNATLGLSSSGAYTAGNVGLSQGPVSLVLGF